MEKETQQSKQEVLPPDVKLRGLRLRKEELEQLVNSDFKNMIDNDQVSDEMAGSMRLVVDELTKIDIDIANLENKLSSTDTDEIV